MTGGAAGPPRPRETGSHPEFRPDVQGLRAVAVVLVVLAHAHVAGFEGGFVGVDVFFVISGFVITGVLLADAGGSGRVGFGRFYARRALRILPAATLVLVVTDLLARHVLTFQHARSVLTDSVWASVFLANVHFSSVGTDYFATDTQVSPLQHFWSLSVEEQFYVIWPLLLAVTLFGAAALRRHSSRAGRRVLRGRAVLVLVVVVGASLTVSVVQTHSSPAAAYFDTFARAWELGIGALVAALLPAIGKLPAPVRAVLTWAGLVAILVASLRYDAGTPFPGTAALLPVLGAAAVVAGGVGAPRGAARSLLSRQPLRYVGDISYSLYLWHWPLLILGADRAGHPLSGVQTLAVVALAVALSALTYAVVENPFRHAARGWAKQPRRAMLLWPVALSVVLISALVARPADPSVQGTGPTTRESAETAVEQAVAAGDRDAPIPHALSPSIGAAPGDFKGIGACSAYKKTTSQVCNFGAPSGTQTVVVVGDSHATMWIPALSRVATAADWRFYPLVKEACSLDQFVSATVSECTDWYSGFVKQQIARLRPAVIVVPIYELASWQLGAERELADFTATGARVVLVSDPPALPQIPADCLAKQGATLGSCQFREAAVYPADDRLADTLAAAAKADFIDVAPWFCAAGSCPSVVDGLITRADNAHITGTYARFLTPELAAAIHLGRA